MSGFGLAGGARALAALALLLLSSSASTALEVPPHEGRRVVDLAGVLPPANAEAITRKLEQLETTDSTQVVVLIVPSLDGESIETFSMRVAESWKVGHKGSDNGVILTVAIAERSLRIEVGYGLEGRLPDITAGRIIRNDIVPHFKGGDYAGGIDRGVDAIIQAVRGEYENTGQPTGTLENEMPHKGLLIFMVVSLILAAAGTLFHRYLGGAVNSVGWLIGGMIFLGVASWLLIVVLLPIAFLAGMFSPEMLRTALSVAMSSRSGGGGGSRSSSFSGGGGSFGGGGASGKW